MIVNIIVSEEKRELWRIKIELRHYQERTLIPDTSNIFILIERRYSVFFLSLDVVLNLQERLSSYIHVFYVKGCQD